MNIGKRMILVSHRSRSFEPCFPDSFLINCVQRPLVSTLHQTLIESVVWRNMTSRNILQTLLACILEHVVKGNIGFGNIQGIHARLHAI